jgi:hypothetical protein
VGQGEDGVETDALVRDFYARTAAREWRRLVKSPFHRLELETTLRFLERHLPPSGLVRGAGVEVVECVGLEGLGSHSIAEVGRLARRDPVAWRNWLEMHDALCTHPGVFATSQHMLVVGRMPASRE